MNLDVCFGTLLNRFQGAEGPMASPSSREINKSMHILPRFCDAGQRAFGVETNARSNSKLPELPEVASGGVNTRRILPIEFRPVSTGECHLRSGRVLGHQRTLQDEAEDGR